MKTKPYWIKERYNPQLGVYFVPMGQLSCTAAKKHTKTSYGENMMHKYSDKESYDKELRALHKRKERVVIPYSPPPITTPEIE